MKETQQNVEEAESKASVQIINHEQEICKWPTETFAIDHYHYREDEDDNPNSDPELEPTMIYPHTVLMFVPGNPGCAGWYISMLKTIIEKLGRGYSCRAVSYAGHGTLPHLVRGKRNHLDHESKNVNMNMNMNIAWSVDGQVEHKVQWVDMITREFVSRRRSSSNKRNSNIHSHSHSHRIPRYIFISHSIGSHLVQRICVLREDILLQTQALIHLMPFIRFDPSPKWKGKLLSAFGNMPNLSIPMLKSASRVAAKVPERVLDAYLEHVAGVGLDEDRKLAKGLMTNHDYTENFLRLGLEEIRDVPQTPEVSKFVRSMQYNISAISILYYDVTFVCCMDG